jgi:hypothetical protein
MQTPQASRTDETAGQAAIVAGILQTIEARTADRWSLPVGEAVAGDELVEAAGRLALLASPELRSVCAQTLWPRVRACLGLDSPAALARGDFGPYLQQAQAVLDPAPVLLRLAARSAPAGDDGERHGDALAHQFLARLDAGLFLTGLETLWPEAGGAAARRLWHEGGLEQWDAYLKGHLPDFAPLHGGAGHALAGLPLPLLGAWLDTVNRLAGAQSEEGTATSPETAGFDAQLLGMLLLEELLFSSGLGQCRVYPTDRPFLLLARHPEGAAVGVWIPAVNTDDIAIPADTAAWLDLLVHAEVVPVADWAESDEEGEEDGQEVWMLVLQGAVSGDALAEQVSGETARLAREVFKGDHEETLSSLVETLSPRGSHP